MRSSKSTPEANDGSGFDGESLGDDQASKGSQGARAIQIGLLLWMSTWGIKNIFPVSL